jgi:multiple sugar transport system substrate-binding protein
MIPEHPEARETLDEIIGKIRSGRLTRRGFLERAIAVGLSSTAAVSLLEACGGTSNSTGGNGQTANIVWQSENDATNTYGTLVQTFNNGIGKQKGVHVTWLQGPTTSDGLLVKYNNNFRARSSSLDVFSIDIIYPAQFSSAGWTKEITDTMWPASARSNYLQGPIKGCTYQGKIWAVPFRTDLGVLYHRTDIVKTAPTTWDDLTTMSQSFAPSKVKYGYVWQGSQYEGLVCDFVEVLYSYGGSVLDPNDATKVTVNSPEAAQALAKMASWVGTISPAAVTTYQEDQARATWQSGASAFMRNWPYAIALGNDPKNSTIAGKFDISALPYGTSGQVGHSAIGGWNLAISNYSKNPDAAWEFVQYLISADAQKTTAINASLTVTLQSIYTDPSVLAKQPLFGKLGPILQNALPRPVSAKYTDVSTAIQQRVHSALIKQSKPADALSGLASDLQTVVQ